MSIEIDLEFKPEYIREIYFKNKEGNYITGSTTQSPFRYLFISGALLFFVALRNQDDFVYILVVFLLFLASLGAYVSAAIRLYNWKAGIKEFIRVNGEYANHLLMLSEESFSLKQDQIEYIEKWDTVKKVKITPEYIRIESSESFLFPMKSIGEKDYERVCEFISEKAK